jgi:hypothetical protein
VGKAVADALKPKPTRATRGRALSTQDAVDIKAMDLQLEKNGLPKRAAHKYQKNPRTHGAVPARVLAKAGVSPYGNFDVDGSGLHDTVHVGSRGGIVRQ